MSALAWILALSGCAAEPAEHTLTVLAASSLTELFTELEADFEAMNPGTDVVLSFAGSQTLVTQVRHGLQADVLATADLETLQALTDLELAEPARFFASSRLVLAVPADTEPMPTLEDLPHLGSLVLGAAEVPVGRYTEALFDAAEARYGASWRHGVDAAVVSREPSVRLVAAKIALGEADVAVVYATDVLGLPGLVAVPLPPALSPSVRVHHARLAEAPEPGLAEAWMALVEGAGGQATLARRGFGAPGS